MTQQIWRRGIHVCAAAAARRQLRQRLWVAAVAVDDAASAAAHLKKGFASLMRVNQSLSRDLMMVVFVMKPLPQLRPGGKMR